MAFDDAFPICSIDATNSPQNPFPVWLFQMQSMPSTWFAHLGPTITKRTIRRHVTIRKIDSPYPQSNTIIHPKRLACAKTEQYYQKKFPGVFFDGGIRLGVPPLDNGLGLLLSTISMLPSVGESNGDAFSDLDGTTLSLLPNLLFRCSALSPLPSLESLVLDMSKGLRFCIRLSKALPACRCRSLLFEVEDDASAGVVVRDGTWSWEPRCEGPLEREG